MPRRHPEEAAFPPRARFPSRPRPPARTRPPRRSGLLSRTRLPLYARIARYGFRRHSAYRAAALAGAFTNTVFGILRAYVLIALWQARPGLAGYDVADAVTFCFLSQAFIGPMQLFGGGLQLAERVRGGDIAVDLARPASLQAWNLADDLGRAAYLLLLRSVPPTLVGAALFGVVFPADPAVWGFFAVSFLLGVIVSFGWRYLVALSSFWIVDDRGTQSLSLVLMMFFSGMVLPLNLFPGWLGALAQSLPWAAMVQIPADVYLGKRDVPQALALQLLWAAALLALGALATRAARRKVVVQGG
ncbi:ABC transporter permease [Planobispora longispora]|uniref:ABC transporter permease n=1 Tax=Planobispora longispora TaxID=28887 RepID=A0A8J3W2U2_9ACTN|nr:ABC-2 family transporter protein [Planobispora longispora]GIH73625.1 ABC transporter permease [Planobispora longispora]